jgi:hypothetical protein
MDMRVAPIEAHSTYGPEAAVCAQLVTSMRHQAADRTLREQITGHPAEHPFVEPAMAVSSDYQEVNALIICPRDDLIRTRATSLHFDPRFCLYPVLREITNDIIDAIARSRNLLLLAYLQNGYAFCLMKKW